MAFAIMYQYKNADPDVLDVFDTKAEAEYVMPEYAMAYAGVPGEAKIWIDDNYEEED